MEDRLLVGALRSRDPDAIGAVYDAYADRLYDYCWFRLRNRDAALVALRDTMMCADARIGELRDPTRFGPWLYAIARIECRRRSLPDAIEPDIPIARHDQGDVDLRLMAWRAVAVLPVLSQDLLDLRHRRDLAVPDIASVTGLPPKDVDDLIGQAGVLLHAAIAAEILAHEEPFECDGRAAILRRRRGQLDDDLRDALARHASGCASCARHLPRSVSAAKVCALLPRAMPPAVTRSAVTGCFTDPELAGYRMLAAARLPRFGAHGFPEQTGTGRAATLGRTPSRWPRATAAMAAALVTALGAAQVARWLADHPTGTRVIGIGPVAPTSRVPRPAPLTPPAAGRPAATELPGGAPAPPIPAVALRQMAPALPPVRGAGRLAVEPADLLLTSGGVGRVSVRAIGGPVTWQALAGGPVTVGPSAGALGPGGTETVTVRAPGGGPGRALIAFLPGDARVAVAWARPGTPPVTAPPPSSPPSSPPPSSQPPSSPPPSPNPPPSASAPPASGGAPPTPSAPSTPHAPAPASASAPTPAIATRRTPSSSARPAPADAPEASPPAVVRRRPEVPVSRPAPPPEPTAS